jgi:type II secretory pathway component PulF
MGLGEVARRLEDGIPLETALAERAHLFPPLLRALVGAGERSGNAGPALRLLRGLYERRASDTRSGVHWLLYPTMVTTCLTLFPFWLFIYTLPKYEPIFSSLGSFPWFAFRAYHWATIGVAGIMGGLILAVNFLEAPYHHGWVALRSCAPLLDRVLLLIPGLRGAVKRRAAHLFAATTSILLRAGARLPEAVRSASACCGNGVLAPRLAAIASSIDEGHRFSVASRLSRLLPRALVWQIEMGEASGDLAQVLEEGALRLEGEDQVARTALITALCGSVLVLNGLLILALLFLVLGPLWKLTAQFAT